MEMQLIEAKMEQDPPDAVGEDHQNENAFGEKIVKMEGRPSSGAAWGGPFCATMDPPMEQNVY